jgi:hypothetical protein
MPFRVKETLPPSPTVQIFFSGLILLLPDSTGSACDVAIHRRSPEHHLTIEVREKMRGAVGTTTDRIIMRHVGPLEFDALINVPSAIEGVRKYIPTESFDRAATGPEPHPNDFRWIIDLASDTEFHGPTLNRDRIDNAGVNPHIRITDGVFYTARKTDPTEVKITRKKGRKLDNETQGPILPDLPLRSIAAIIGANIYLNDTNKMELTWRENGERRTLRLSKPPAASAVDHYEIYIINDPLFTDPTQQFPTHDEFEEFYKVVDVFKSARFALAVEMITQGGGGAPPPSLGTPTIPCMPITHGG